MAIYIYKSYGNLNPIRRMAGFGLIEILVTLIIIAIGLLGLAGIQTRAQQAELESNQRAQALLLLQDMINRINANRKTAGCYAITDSVQGSPSVGFGNTTTFTCNAFGTAATQALFAADIAAWDDQLKGQVTSLNGQNAGAMIGARGCIGYDAVNDIYTVSIAWQGLTETVIPANTCGTGLYGSEAMRRVVSNTLRIADLN